jgi:N-acetylmuramoyl-L-alanine amidase
MITLAWYLLKVMICSGILCSYYFLALRNKIFHRWNRFYLLASIVLALLVPLIKINIFQKPDADKGTVIQMLQTINRGDEVVIEYSRNNGFHINAENMVALTYMLISAAFLTIFFIALYKIIRLKKKYPETQIEGISFINTNAKGTPFSFFNSIFWNNAIDLHSKPGQQILNHEIAHVKEKHSFDKIFLNVVMIFFWINPFFWLIRKELHMIHEFIADQEALEDNDLNAFAEMILQTVYPGQNFSLTNNFFYSPIKRRIMMLTKNRNPKVNYLSRLLVLPLAAIVFFAFSLKLTTAHGEMYYDGKTITVVVDAGHGGADNGAISPTGLIEKNLTLSIAKKIAALNSNDHINILLSRQNDQTLSVKDRVEFAKEKSADIFISIHLSGTQGNEKTEKSGISVLIDKNNNNLLLASSLIGELKKSYSTADKVGTRNIGVLVLDQNICPSALIECGFINNPADAEFMINNSNQEKIAQNVLDAINAYASSLNTKTGSAISEMHVNYDTIPRMYYKGKKVTSLEVHESKNTVKVKYADGSSETITKEEAKKRGFILPPPPPPPINPPAPPAPPVNPPAPPAPPAPPVPLRQNGAINIKETKNITSKALIILNGQEISQEDMKFISPDDIESVNVLKNESAIKYGEKGKYGVIEIFTKKAKTLPKDSQSISPMPKVSQVRWQNTNPAFSQVEHEATFPGGQRSWQKYITRRIQEVQDSLTEKDFGTCILKFIVSKDGTVSQVQATTMKGTKLAELAVSAVRKGPKWNPAIQNGHKVNSVRLQPVTLSNPD